MGNQAEIPLAKGRSMGIAMETRYPWEGEVEMTLTSVPDNKLGEVRLRIPNWCKKSTIKVNGTEIPATPDKGYAVLAREWQEGDKILLSMEMPVEVVAADPRVKANEGRRAVQRGPLVYCMEETDNREGFAEAALTPDTRFVPEYCSDLLNGVVLVTATNSQADSLRFIPYYAWDNREAGKMQLWIPLSASVKP